MSFHGTTTTKNSDASLEGVPYMGFAFFHSGVSIATPRSPACLPLTFLKTQEGIVVPCQPETFGRDQP
jgi:hypothetical protein